MGFFDRIREKDRKLRESNRKELARVDAKLAPYTKRKLNITQDDDTVSPVARQVHITIDPLPPKNSNRITTKKPLRASKSPTAADVANRSARIDAELARNKRDRDAQKTSAPAPKQEVVIGTASVSRAARPDPVKPVPQATRTVSTPSPAPKPRNYSTEAADRLKKLGLGEYNAVVGRLRERAEMTQEERDKPFGTDNAVLTALRAKGYNFAKGGKINGAARKGKTKGRFI